MLRTGGLRTETVRTAPEDGTDRSGVVWGASLQRRLSRADAEGEAGDIQWNFEKFLLSADGEVVGRFRPRTEPEATEVVEAIERTLG